LGWFHLHEHRQNVQDVEQFGRVFGQLVVGLNVAQLGRWPAIGAKKLRERMLKKGFDPASTEFSQGIIAMRQRHCPTRVGSP
jgi:hypothetical protein